MSEGEITLSVEKLARLEKVMNWIFALLAACFMFGAWLTKNTMELTYLVDRVARVEQNEAQNTDKLETIGKDLAGLRADVSNLKTSVDDLRQLLRSKQ